MRHGFHGPFVPEPWIVGVCILGLIILVTAVIWFVHRHTAASDGLSPLERKELSHQEREIISMLFQHGGPLKQKEMMDELPGDFKELVEAMNSLEKRGFIRREWNAEEETYIVSMFPKD